MGIYDNFPESYHSITRFSFKTSAGELQKALLKCLYELNRNKRGVDLPEFSRHSIDVELDFGIADGLTFNYLNKETMEYCLVMLGKQMSSVLDFLCIVRYYAVGKDRRSPLKFDYHMLRFLFEEKEVELRVYHEKGTRRLSIEDLVTFLMQKMNRNLRRKSSPL